MKVDTSPAPRTAAAPATPATETKRASPTKRLDASQQTGPAAKRAAAPELRIDRGNDSLEISAAGRALLAQSLHQRSDPAQAAKQAQAAAAPKPGETPQKPQPGEVPNLLVAKT